MIELANKDVNINIFGDFMRKSNTKSKFYTLLCLFLLIFIFSSCSILFNSSEKDGDMLNGNKIDEDKNGDDKGKSAKGDSKNDNKANDNKGLDENQGGFNSDIGVDEARQEEIFTRIFKQVDFSKSFNAKYEAREFRKLLITAKNDYEISKTSNLTRDDYLEELKLLKKYIPETGDIIDNFDKLDTKIIDSLLKYPENFLWAYSFLNKDSVGNESYISSLASQSGAILTDEEKAEPIPYFSQVDLRWGLKEYGGSYFGRAGCGPTVMSMLVVGLTKDYGQDPYEVGKFARENRYYLDNIGTEWSFFSQGVKHYGLKSKDLKFEEKVIVSELEAGNYIVLNVRKGDFTYSGHYIIISGYDGNEFKILDPNSWINTSKSWTFDRLKEQVKAAWSIGK